MIENIYDSALRDYIQDNIRDWSEQEELQLLDWAAKVNKYCLVKQFIEEGKTNE